MIIFVKELIQVEKVIEEIKKRVNIKEISADCNGYNTNLIIDNSLIKYIRIRKYNENIRGIRDNIVMYYQDFDSENCRHIFTIEEIYKMDYYLTCGSIRFNRNQSMPLSMYIEYPLPFYMFDSVIKNTLVKIE